MAVKRTKNLRKGETLHGKATPGKHGTVRTDLLDRVRVRMYRVGFGECFLLTFPRLGAPFHMLIECGSVDGPKIRDVMKRVVQDIRETTLGQLDVVVVTHRHRDKLSGFIQAQEVFDHIKVGQVWLNWTENPDDPAVRQLRRKLNLGSLNDIASPNERAVEYVRRLGKRVCYWRGGQGPIALSGVPGVRIFILGPPTLNADLFRAQSAIAAAEGKTVSPFGEAFRISLEEARNDPIFEPYFGSVGVEGSAEDVRWRQIGVEREKIPNLRLDRPEETNNTSLAMAIELIGPRDDSRVLLFPGDAQLASWFSWHEHRWLTGAPPRDPQPIACRKLLERTVLYKVSNYGSRTGTPIEFGLDMMNSPDLVAMIPGVKGKYRQVPSPELLAALKEKTHGRIISAEAGFAKSSRKARAPTVTGQERFQDSVRESQLYIDCFVAIPQLTAVERQQTAENWAAANERRVYLVDKKLAGTIRPEEESELREIEKLMDEYLSTTAPTGLGLFAELRRRLE